MSKICNSEKKSEKVVTDKELRLDMHMNDQ